MCLKHFAIYYKNLLEEFLCATLNIFRLCYIFITYMSSILLFPAEDGFNGFLLPDVSNNFLLSANFDSKSFFRPDDDVLMEEGNGVPLWRRLLGLEGLTDNRECFEEVKGGGGRVVLPMSPSLLAGLSHNIILVLVLMTNLPISLPHSKRRKCYDVVITKITI